MDKINKFSDLYKLIIATIATILTTFIIDWLRQKTGDRNFAAVLAIIIVSVVMILLNFILENSFENSVILRKMVFGNDFIEGYWYDVSFNEKERTIEHAILMKISYGTGKFNINGVTYDKVGNRIATWKSLDSNYCERILFYQYEAHTNVNNNEIFIEKGINQLCFDIPPNSYTGFYIDYANKMRYNICGEKVDKKEMKEYNNFKSSKDKSNFLNLKVKEFEQNLLKKGMIEA